MSDDHVRLLEAELEFADLWARLQAHQANNCLTTLGTRLQLALDLLADDDAATHVRAMPPALEKLRRIVAEMPSGTRRTADPGEHRSFDALRDEVLKMLQAKYRAPLPLDVELGGIWNTRAAMPPARARFLLFMVTDLVVDVARQAPPARATWRVDTPDLHWSLPTSAAPGDGPWAAAEMLADSLGQALETRRGERFDVYLRARASRQP